MHNAMLITMNIMNKKLRDAEYHLLIVGETDSENFGSALQIHNLLIGKLPSFLPFITDVYLFWIFVNHDKSACRLFSIENLVSSIVG
jgi:hypothetical protein